MIKVVQVQSAHSQTIIAFSQIGGNVHLTDQVSGQYVITFNTIGGNVKIQDNTATTFGFSTTIAVNTIGGDLRCEGNSPPPNNGVIDPNTVNGIKSGQCAEL